MKVRGIIYFHFSRKNLLLLKLLSLKQQQILEQIGNMLIVLNNENLVDQFYVKEPRSNSENTEIGDFIKTYMKNNMLTLNSEKIKLLEILKIQEI